MFAQSSLKWVITATGPGGAPEPLRVDGDGALVVTVDASVISSKRQKSLAA